MANIKTTRPENDFELLQKIGSGTYGEVFKANVKATGTLAAVKIINIEPGDPMDIIQREIILMQDFSHENIVQYHGSYLKKGRLWIAMEFCGGGSLQDIYSVTGGLTEPMISFTCGEMLKGLHYMHQQKKLHRDIKGANILLTVDGDVKLADFGVGAQITTTLGKKNSFIGTPYWMAPEVAAVDRTGGYDCLCDVWAVGITAIELAECQPPLFDLHPMKALSVISRKNYTPPTLQSKGKPRWTNSFKDFLKQCLAKNPQKRPDAGSLLGHAFCKGSHTDRSVMRKLLDKYERMEQYKSYFVSGDNDGGDNVIEHEKEPEKTFGRIKSTKKVPSKKIPPALPAKSAKPQLEVSGCTGCTSPIGEEDQEQKAIINELKATLDNKSNHSPPYTPLRPQPPTKAPKPPKSPLNSRPASVTHDQKSQGVPPPVPLRSGQAEKAQNKAQMLTGKSIVYPPPIPFSSGAKAHRHSHLFAQTAAKTCFTKIFTGCPLDILHATSWKHPETKNTFLLLATNEGIYSLSLEENEDAEMIQIFSRTCRWVHAFKNILVSICGTASHVFMHNLISLHEKKDSVERYVPKTKGVAFTMKIQGTANTLKCCVADNPHNNEIYLYAAGKDGILMLQWFEPLQKFMIFKDVACTLPPRLTIFEPITKKGVRYPLICVGAYHMENGDVAIDIIDIESEDTWKPRPEYKKVCVKSLCQLGSDLILIAYDTSAAFIDNNGKAVDYEDGVTKFNFDHDIEDVVCLPGSVLTFHISGVQGKAIYDSQQTACLYDASKEHKLLCSEKVVVLERRSTTGKEISSKLYILANEQT